MVAIDMYFNAQGQELKNMVPTTTFYKSYYKQLRIIKNNTDTNNHHNSNRDGNRGHNCNKSS